jgi:hypothetical protein
LTDAAANDAPKLSRNAASVRGAVTRPQISAGDSAALFRKTVESGMSTTRAR